MGRSVPQLDNEPPAPRSSPRNSPPPVGRSTPRSPSVLDVPLDLRRESPRYPLHRLHRCGADLSAAPRRLGRRRHGHTNCSTTTSNFACSNSSSRGHSFKRARRTIYVVGGHRAVRSVSLAYGKAGSVRLDPATALASMAWAGARSHAHDSAKCRHPAVRRPLDPRRVSATCSTLAGALRRLRRIGAGPALVSLDARGPRSARAAPTRDQPRSSSPRPPSPHDAHLTPPPSPRGRCRSTSLNRSGRSVSLAASGVEELALREHLVEHHRRCRGRTNTKDRLPPCPCWSR